MGISIVIILYYTVIIAWALSFVWFSVRADLGRRRRDLLHRDFLRTSDEPGIGLDVVPGVLWPLIGTWVVMLVILALGVQKGLERSNIIFLPMLVVLFAALVVRALFLDGAAEGLNAFFTPDWSALLHPGVWIAAVAQIFFSLSIAFGIMVTYSSLPRATLEPHLVGLVVAFSNSSFEILAGIGVFATLGFMAHQQDVGRRRPRGPHRADAVVQHLPADHLRDARRRRSSVCCSSCPSPSPASPRCCPCCRWSRPAFQEKFGWDPEQAALRVGGSPPSSRSCCSRPPPRCYVLDAFDKWANEVGVITSAVVMTILVAWRLRLLPQLRWHLNAGVVDPRRRLVGSTSWASLVPLVLGYMLVSGVWMLITEGYEGYPLWFRLVFGWGAIAFMVVFAVIMTKDPLGQGPDDFVPWPPLPEGGLTTKGGPLVTTTAIVVLVLVPRGRLGWSRAEHPQPPQGPARTTTSRNRQPTR